MCVCVCVCVFTGAPECNTCCSHVVFRASHTQWGPALKRKRKKICIKHNPDYHCAIVVIATWSHRRRPCGRHLCRFYYLDGKTHPLQFHIFNAAVTWQMKWKTGVNVNILDSRNTPSPKSHKKLSADLSQNCPVRDDHIDWLACSFVGQLSGLTCGRDTACFSVVESEPGWLHSKKLKFKFKIKRFCHTNIARSTTFHVFRPAGVLMCISHLAFPSGMLFWSVIIRKTIYIYISHEYVEHFQPFLSDICTDHIQLVFFFPP